MTRTSLFFCAVCLCPPLLAQPLTSHRDSLQWMIADSDAIVRGRVRKVSPINPDDAYVRYHLIAVDPVEEIYGEVGPTLDFVVGDPQAYVRLHDEKKVGLFLPETELG